ncbi:cupin domain-containing protein [Mucilaginibacter sp.]
MDNSKKPAQIVKADEGKGLSVVGDSYRIVISGKETNGAYAVIDMLVSPNGGPGPHAHAAFQETFHILDGEIELKTENGTYLAGKGDFVNIPSGGIVHCFKNKTENIAHLWCVVVPAGLEAFFEEIGKPIEFGKFETQPDLTEDDAKKLQQIAEKYGQQLYPPNYFDK